MRPDEFAAVLRRLGACQEAREWAAGKSLDEVYSQLERADWWLWLAAKAGVERKRVVLAACACARTALKRVPAGEGRPLAAIELAERWARGEEGVTLEQVRTAADAAAYAAAAYAAYAAYAAAAYAAYAAYAATRTRALADMVPLVKEHLPLEVVRSAMCR